MAAMGSMGSRARLWLDTPSMALKWVVLMYELSLIGTFLRWAPRDNSVAPG